MSKNTHKMLVLIATLLGRVLVQPWLVSIVWNYSVTRIFGAPRVEFFDAFLLFNIFRLILPE